MLRRTVPILATGDVSRAVAHYAALGFETEQWEGGGYGFVMRDGVEVLHLSEREEFDPATNTASCYLHVRDADALYAEWAAAGVEGELACHGGQREAAEYLLNQGADPNWIAPWDGLTPLDAAMQEGHEELGAVLEARGAKRSGDLAT